jgi:PAS domain S-box-containing protein
MNPSFWFGPGESGDLQVLHEDGERVLCRGWRDRGDGERTAVLAVLPASEHPPPGLVDRLTHEYELKDELDRAWAVRPLELVREDARTMLLLEDPGGGPLDRLLDRPFEIGKFLRLAVALSAALREVHQRGLIHKDIQPANVLVDVAGNVRLMAFGTASRLPRERQSSEPPEFLAGTLPYMAPEQTGRMNRSIDTRSDLYSLGVTLYQMLTGVLPFAAADPMEWIHCHIARRPTPPSERAEGVPEPVEAIVLKLLAKSAEDRYQTAAGLEADLRACLTAWEAHGRIEPFPLGAHDVSDRLIIPEKLYGREAEIDALISAFDQVVTRGTTELVLVSGHAGIGKSSLVHELHKELVPPRGLFAAGKLDQYKRNIPYATLAKAFESLVDQILSKSDAELSQWRSALQEALGPNGQLMVNLIPQLALVIGEQPPAPDLSSQDQQARFQLVFRNFLGVFARPEHPLALFLDDLQWLDSATLDLIEHLAAHPEVRHLLLIGAFRDDEVGPSHPLARVLATIRAAAGTVREIKLRPFRPGDVQRLIADALRTEHPRTLPLADLVFEKTAGNPFFTIQFLLNLAEEGLLTFDGAATAWTWDLPRIRAKGFTDNVADLMAAKLGRLPAATRSVLGQLACLGNVAEAATLTLVHGGTEAAMHAALWEAVRGGLVLRSDSTYTFLHDRIQEAAYALIPEDERAMAHLRTGRLLAARTTPADLEENIFEIVNQFDRGAGLIVPQEERELVAEFNLMAGRRAKAASAYAAALQYFTAGRALLAETGWQRCHRLTFELALNRAECEYLTGELTSADERLSALSRRARTTVDSAAVTCVRLNLYTTLGQSNSAVGVGLDYLQRVDDQWPVLATAEHVRQEYDRIWQLLGSRSIEALLDLPLMTDPDRRATMDVLTALASLALFTDDHLFRLVIGRMAALSLEHGNSDGSCLAYAWLGGILGTYFGDYQAGFRFGRLGLDLVEKRGLDRFRARVYLVFGAHVSPWTQPQITSRGFLRYAFEAAKQAGDQIYAAYSFLDLITNLLAAGDPLVEVERQAENGLEFVQRVQFGLISDVITAQLRLIRLLRGLTPGFNSFNDAQIDEDSFERHLEGNPRLANTWIRKLQSCIYAHAYASANAAASKAAALLWRVPTQFELAEYHFYGALARAGHWAMATSEERARHLEALAAHHEQIALWAESCPRTFANRAALVGAEIARLEGRDLDAMHLYEQAIRSARDHGFVHNEALANELAGRFYLDRGLEKNGYAHLRDARACYALWGADAKVMQLDRLYPRLAAPERPRATATVGPPIQLDVTSIVKASQAVSSEIVLPTLIERLMTIVLENAGADRGLLILPAEGEHVIQAEAQAAGDKVEVVLCQAPITSTAGPEGLLRYVIHTHESVILDDVARPNLFSEDEYLRGGPARSVLCLPLIKQGQLTGLLYLENRLTSHAFTPDRIAVLDLLAAQAAISLENTRLYSDLQEREAKVRRLVDSDIIGICIWQSEGNVLEANDAFLDMVGYSRDDLISGRVRWTALTPAEWREADARAAAEIRATGSCKAFETEYVRKDGSRVPVLIGAATFGERQDHGVAFVLDLTERKRADENLRESERRYREAQMELAHANRVTTMGQLAASIAHEVMQPVAAAVTNANAALRWLGRHPPDLEEVRQAVDRIVRNGKRAGDILGRIRALIKKVPPRHDRLDINETILEVIELTRSELLRHRISLQTELAQGLPMIRGDRIQLQQVIVNLVINAVEAMSDAGESRELLISTAEDEGSGVLVSVRDSGPGPTPESFDHLFDAFYTTKPGGMGMGLSICRSIIEAHGGRIWAIPNAGPGITVQFALPISEPAESVKDTP